MGGNCHCPGYTIEVFCFVCNGISAVTLFELQVFEKIAQVPNVDQIQTGLGNRPEKGIRCAVRVNPSMQLTFRNVLTFSVDSNLCIGECHFGFRLMILSNRFASFRIIKQDKKKSCLFEKICFFVPAVRYGH